MRAQGFRGTQMSASRSKLSLKRQKWCQPTDKVQILCVWSLIVSRIKKSNLRFVKKSTRPDFQAKNFTHQKNQRKCIDINYFSRI